MHRLANEYSLKALAASPSNRNLPAIGRLRLEQEKAFTAGLEAVKTIVVTESERLRNLLEKNKAGESQTWSAIADGVRWLEQAILKGIDNEK